MSDWRRLSCAGLQSWVRVHRGRLEVRGLDLQAERLAWEVSGHTTLGVVALLVLERILMEVPQRERQQRLNTELKIFEMNHDEWWGALNVVDYAVEQDIWAARHDLAPPELLRWLAQGRAALLHEVADHPNTPGDLLERLYARGMVYEVLSHPCCPPAVFERALGKGEPSELQVMAANSDCPPTLLEKLAEHGLRVADLQQQRQLLKTLAKNPTLPGPLLWEMTRHADREVADAGRWAITIRDSEAMLKL